MKRLSSILLILALLSGCAGTAGSSAGGNTTAGNTPGGNTPGGNTPAAETTANQNGGTGGETAALAEETTLEQGVAEDLTKLTFVLDWTPNTNHTGIYVAQKLGYYAEAGLAVEIQNPPEDGAEMLVAAGRADIGVSFQDYLAPAFASENPMPLTAIAALAAHNTSGIISLKEDGITSPAKLEGKVYSTWGLPVEQAIMKQVVEDDGGDWAKVALFTAYVENIEAALKTQVDAVWVYYGWDGIALQQAGLETNYWNFKDINPVFDFYSPVLITNNTYLAEHPAEVRAFLEATRKGYQYAIDNPAEAAQILLEAAPGLDPGIVEASQTWLSDQYIADSPRWGYMDQTRWDNFYRWLWDKKLIDVEIPAGTGFTNDYLPAA